MTFWLLQPSGTNDEIDRTTLFSIDIIAERIFLQILQNLLFWSRELELWGLKCLICTDCFGRQFFPFLLNCSKESLSKNMYSAFNFSFQWISFWFHNSFETWKWSITCYAMLVNWRFMNYNLRKNSSTGLGNFLCLEFVSVLCCFQCTLWGSDRGDKERQSQTEETKRYTDRDKERQRQTALG